MANAREDKRCDYVGSGVGFLHIGPFSSAAAVYFIVCMHSTDFQCKKTLQLSLQSIGTYILNVLFANILKNSAECRLYSNRLVTYLCANDLKASAGRMRVPIVLKGLSRYYARTLDGTRQPTPAWCDSQHTLASTAYYHLLSNNDIECSLCAVYKQ